MELFDTHCHLASRKLAGETDALIKRARAEQVTKIITIGCQCDDSAQNVQLAAAHKAVYATVGVHPTSIHEIPENWLSVIKDLARQPKVVALGEMGLDYYHPPQDGSTEASWRDRQASIFQRQVELAKEIEFPMVIHTRESFEDTVDILRPFAGTVKAVFHCFSGSPQEARTVLDLGFHLSFTGVITYKNAGDLAETAASLPLDRIMVETDAPYLTPVPHRGKRNEPSFVRHTAAFLANQKGVALEELAEETSATANHFFRGLDSP
ncbi:MAG: TatD family hydrolase [Verrucomicrobiota bacterium]